MSTARIVRASPDQTDLVLRLVKELLLELEDQPDELRGFDERKVVGDMNDQGERYTAFLAQDPDGKWIGVVTVMEAFAIYANGKYGIIDEMYVAPPHRSTRCRETAYRRGETTREATRLAAHRSDSPTGGEVATLSPIL